MEKLDFKRYTFIIGNFGSGKTEIAINLALRHAAMGSSMLIDMDIINPYFKSSSKEKILRDAGVEVVKPDFANTTMDVPTLPPEIYSPFDRRPDHAVFDVGGDPVGAAVLGLLKDHVREAREECEFLFVINPMRPMQENKEAIKGLLREMMDKASLEVDRIVINGNLAYETELEHVVHSEKIGREVSSDLGIPIKCICMREELSDEYKGDLPVLPIHIYMRPAWLDERP
ncbi:MAG: hypothetical protein IJK00_05030 [Clostridia bacterium]|nr:hypothetical protein [Clostridia bacterium]